jgi:hypothetical protein
MGWAVPQALSEAHWRGSIYKGESGSAYLGIAGILALGWLLLRFVGGVVRGRATGAALPVLAVGWILLFSVVGGMNSLLGVVGFIWLRGSNRFSIWILCIALLTAATALSRLRLLPRSGWPALVGVALLAAALADQIPPHAAADPLAVRASLASDRQFVATMESLLPPGGAVFVEPALGFPEDAHRFRERDYEPLRIYLHASRMRMSYGTDKNRPGSGLAPTLAAHAAARGHSALRERGFAGVVLLLRALPDGGLGFLEALSSADRRRVVRSADGHFLFLPFSPPDVAPAFATLD